MNTTASFYVSRRSSASSDAIISYLGVTHLDPRVVVVTKAISLPQVEGS